MSNARQLLNDCFLHDKDRMKHNEVLETLSRNISVIVDDEIASLDDSAERTCAQTIRASRNVPQTDNTAVDGYAFNHSDYLKNNGTFELGALIAAGQTHQVTLKKNECARIFTGAIMPTNADTVAMQEDCTINTDGAIQIPNGLKFGANCRLAGEDLASGDAVINDGDIVTPARLAALASIGISKIKLRKKLNIAILSTGNEVIEATADIKLGQIFDANRPMLKALLKMDLVTIDDLGIIPDDETLLSNTLAEASKKYDLIVTSGSASRGDEDHMLNALDKLGKRHLWQIAIKPGRPMMFGQIGNCVVMGLPGNPVAAFVCTHLYVFPIIAQLTGTNHQPPQAMEVAAGFNIKQKKTDRREFLRGRLENDDSGRIVATKFDRDGSGLISGLRFATGLIEIPEHVDQVSTGDIVRFIPFSSYKLG